MREHEKMGQLKSQVSRVEQGAVGPEWKRLLQMNH
jgi:hypothetical protein